MVWEGADLTNGTSMHTVDDGHRSYTQDALGRIDIVLA